MEIQLQESRIVLVDLDGVAGDFEAPVTAELAQNYPHIQRLDPTQYPPSLYTPENYPPEHAETIWSIINKPDYERTLPLMPGVIEGWTDMIDAQYEPRFCTTLRPAEYAPNCLENKIAWIREHFVPVFGEWAVEKAIFTPRKDKANGAILIEDRPAPLKGVEEASWEPVVFDQPYNRNPESSKYIRLHGWSDPDLIPKLDEAHSRYRYGNR